MQAPLERVPEEHPAAPPTPAEPTLKLAPEPRRRWFGWIALGVSLLLLAATIGVIAWQRDTIDDQDATIVTTQELVVGAQSEITAQDAALRASADRVDRLTGVMARLRARMAEQAVVSERLERHVAYFREQLAIARADYREARATMLALIGVPLADGTWNGEIMMMGGTQDPPMLTLHEMDLYGGEPAMFTAGMAAGCRTLGMTAQAGDSEWVTMAVSPSATVTLQTWKPRHNEWQPVDVSVAKFGQIYNGYADWNAQMRYQFYEVDVTDGTVTAIREVMVGC